MPHPKIDFSHTSAFDKFIWFCGVGLGSGLTPKAQGTSGSFAILFLYPVWLWMGFVPSLIVIILMSLVGIYICGRAAQIMHVHDDGRIVWDEFAGQSITLLPLIYWTNLAWWWIIPAFILFRFFDILKPFPISWADRSVRGGLGIMLDDILAGVIAMLGLIAILRFIV